MNNGRREYEIIWFIENYSFCWLNNGEKLESPEFIAEGLEGTVWHLSLYPRGSRDEIRSKISLSLQRGKLDDGPEDMRVKYELSFRTADGSVLISQESEHTFRNGISYGWKEFAQMDEVLLHRKTDFLPQDRLCVRCIIWKGEGNVQSITQFRAVTRIGIEHVSFLHVVEDFSALKSNEKKTVQIRSPSGDELLSSSFHFCDRSCNGKIMIEITSDNRILTKFKLSLLDRFGKLKECNEADIRYNATREDIEKLSLPLTRTVILNRKSEYLQDDKLSLLCDCTFSTEIELGKIEKTLHELPLVAVNPISIDNQNKNTYNAVKKLSACPNALDDFKAIYNNLFLTDVELRTRTKSFPAHKIVLCARSSVFKAMLTNDMKEKITDCIKVDDMENDTVQQLLLFLYSDKLVNLQWESAINLYYAGDKYDIEKLKVLCSSFLVTNLSTSTAPELLLLAASVLRARLTWDIKENLVDYIHVDDLENDIVRQFLLFLYSDELENLSWESAINLYYVGVTYDVEKLKVLCSSFLVANLSSSTAPELLLLAASVLRARLTWDIKENLVDYIHMDDLENDIVRQFLLFLYSDELENLLWESAIHLYYVGVTYDVEKLKLLCSSFLVTNLSTSTAPELLLLADTHSDSDLRKFVENYILEHEEKIFGSDEWEKLMEVNPPLVFKIMCSKYKRNEGDK